MYVDTWCEERVLSARARANSPLYFTTAARKKIRKKIRKSGVSARANSPLCFTTAYTYRYKTMTGACTRPAEVAGANRLDSAHVRRMLTYADVCSA